MNRNASWRGVDRVLGKLSDEALLAIQDHEVLFLKYIEGDFLLEIAKSIFVFPVDDKDAFPHEKHFLAHMRERGRKEHPDYQGPHLWETKTGLNFRLHGSKLGVPLYGDWNYLQGWKLQNDENTEASRVLWTPRLVNGSKCKMPSEMKDVLAADYKKWKLPDLDRAKPFGSVSLNTGLIAAHRKRTNGAECIPLNVDYAVTDTQDVDGRYLVLGNMREYGLHCGRWDEGRTSSIGCFPTVVLPSAA